MNMSKILSASATMEQVQEKLAEQPAPTQQEPGRNHYEDGDVFERIAAMKRRTAQQEPVAWMHVMDNTEGIKANGKGHVSITQKRKHPFGKPGIDFSKSYPVTSTPLYTSLPAQRKPLTDEEIEAVWKRVQANDFHDCVQPFARAIEAAHGIKEKNNG